MDSRSRSQVQGCSRRNFTRLFVWHSQTCASIQPQLLRGHVWGYSSSSDSQIYALIQHYIPLSGWDDGQEKGSALTLNLIRQVCNMTLHFILAGHRDKQLGRALNVSMFEFSYQKVAPSHKHTTHNISQAMAMICTSRPCQKPKDERLQLEAREASPQG